MLVFFTLVWGAIPVAFCIAVFNQFSKHNRKKENKGKKKVPTYKVVRKNVYPNHKPATKKKHYNYSKTENFETGSADTGKYGVFGNGNSENIVRNINTRNKIAFAFNKKYQLNLTEQQLSTLVNFSYLSEIWKVELEAMSLRYETVYEWLQGNTDWLRVYLYVFPVQELNLEFRVQEKFCVYAFEEVFRYADQLGNIPMQEKIERINEKFYTNFDDVTYMIAYRFLESKGLKHELKSQELLVNDSEIDILLEKYATKEK